MCACCLSVGQLPCTPSLPAINDLLGHSIWAEDREVWTAGPDSIPLFLIPMHGNTHLPGDEARAWPHLPPADVALQTPFCTHDNVYLHSLRAWPHVHLMRAWPHLLNSMYACMHDRRTHLPPGDDEISSANEWTIEQNKQLLLHLKQQNKDVKGVSTGGGEGAEAQPAVPPASSAVFFFMLSPPSRHPSKRRQRPTILPPPLKELSGRRLPSARDAGRSQTDKTVEKLEKAVHGLRRSYDKVMQVQRV